MSSTVDKSVWLDVSRHPDPETDLGYEGHQLQKLVFDRSGTVAVMPASAKYLAAEQFLVTDKDTIVDLEEMQ